MSAEPVSIVQDKRKPRKNANAKYKVDVDTKVIRLGTLENKADDAMETGDPVFCDSCGAAVSVISEIKLKENGQKEWNCEFCNFKSIVDMHDEEIPRLRPDYKNDLKINGHSVGFILEPPEMKQDPSEEEDMHPIIVFCVDKSGSMCVTQKASKDFKSKGVSDEFADLLQPGDDRQMSSSKWISRLECVQLAVDSQL